MGSNSLRIRSDEIDGSIKVYDEIRYLVLFGSGLYNPSKKNAGILKRYSRGIPLVFQR